MQRIVQSLPYISRGLAIGAVLAGLATGLLAATIGADFVCFDTCPTRATYFAQLGPTAVRLMTPCVVFEALAMAVFLAYCLATRQVRRAIISLLVLLVGGLVGVAALIALAQHAQATLPIWGGEDGDLLRESPLVAWAHEWGLALTLVAVAWSGVLAYLQWRPIAPNGPG